MQRSFHENGVLAFVCKGLTAWDKTMVNALVKKFFPKLAKIYHAVSNGKANILIQLDIIFLSLEYLFSWFIFYLFLK
jgi:hypothetical protein